LIKSIIKNEVDNEFHSKVLAILSSNLHYFGSRNFLILPSNHLAEDRFSREKYGKKIQYSWWRQTCSNYSLFITTSPSYLFSISMDWPYIIRLLNFIIGFLLEPNNFSFFRSEDLLCCPFWPSLSRSLTVRQSITHSISHSLNQSLTHSISHSLTQSLTHSLTHSISHLLIQSVTHSLIQSVTHSLNQSLTHSISHSLAQM